MNMPDFEAGLLAAVPDIRYFARNLTRNWDAADDLTQDVLEKAIKRRDHFKGGNIAAWLMTMTRNLFTDQYRSKQRKPEVPFDPGRDPRVNPGSVDQQDIMDDLNNAMSRMTQSCQEILSMIGIGYKYAEIALAVGIEKGTVMSRLSRCRKKLAEIIR